MRLSEKFAELKNKKEGALVAYICVGDPTPDDTKRYVISLIKGGVDIIELGMPFSDPVADGPIIQASIERALNAGMNPDIYFKTISSLKIRTPLVVMTYYNLVLKRGILKFVQDCKSSGISAIIIPDLPAEESEELRSLCIEYDIDLIFMVTPTITDIRMERILSQGTGFIYIVGSLGVTGMRSEVAKYTHDLIGRVKKVTIPKVVGFGISNGDQAAEIIRAGADGVIVGSAFVDIIAEKKNVEERLESFARELKERIISVDR